LEITHKFLTTNGIKMHVAMAGEGPIVLLCHGFPESWYSWRHQLKALAGAGYCAVAPDMRGYGQTDKPEAIDQYTMLHLTGDMVGLVEALGFRDAVIVGHDWGAPVAWHSALFRPDKSRLVRKPGACGAGIKRVSRRGRREERRGRREFEMESSLRPLRSSPRPLREILDGCAARIIGKFGVFA